MLLICFLNFNQTGKKDQISQPKNYSNSEVFWTQPHTFAQVKLFLNSKSSSLHSFPTTIVYVKHRGKKSFSALKGRKIYRKFNHDASGLLQIKGSPTFSSPDRHAIALGEEPGESS